MSTRDFAITKLASARYRSSEATGCIDGALELFIDGAGEDADGDERLEAIELAEVELRSAAEHLQAVREAMELLTGDELIETDLEDEEEEGDENEEPKVA